MDIYGFARNLLAQNPDKANTPLGKQLLQILDSQNYSQGEQLASNLCKTYGVDQQQAVQNGKLFFNL